MRAGFVGFEEPANARAALATVEDALSKGWEVKIRDMQTNQFLSIDALRGAASADDS